MECSARRTAIDILVVDSDRDTTDSLADILTSCGYKVAIADGGIEALDFLRRNPPPRMILLDMFMPGMGGVEFLSYKKGSSWENAEIVILSDIKRAQPLPGWTDQVLHRPPDVHSLLSLVYLKLFKK